MNSNNKRKRGPGDQGGGRESKAQNTNGDHQDYAALLQGLEGVTGTDDSTRTAQAALAAPMNQSAYPEPPSFDGAAALSSAFDENSPPAMSGMGNNMGANMDNMGNNMGNNMGGMAQSPMDARGNQNNKPAVGSAEWHQNRKDNHKEVERRRREVINEGIENIAKIVPCSEKNKGAILQRTHQYILEMQAEKAQFQTERATFEIALRELTNRLDRMKESARTAWAESNKWQQRCRDAGLHFDDFDEGTLTGLEEEDVTAADVVS
ncbi:basic helix-loop-helix protein [Exophiala xenobiotica]|nr:basic helix-loop-helix protein [Exophiala xenobiotica]